jgi:hypothetical protein
MSNVVRHYPLGFTQIYLDLVSGDKNPYEAVWYVPGMQSLQQITRVARKNFVSHPHLPVA